MNIFETEWKEASRDAAKSVRNGDFASYRNARYYMSTLVAKEERYENAIYLLCEVVYYDLSCLGDGEKGFLSKDSRKRQQALADWCMHGINFVMAPRVRKNIADYKEKLSWSDDKLWEFASSAFADFSAPFHPFTKDECVSILRYELEGNDKAVSKMIKAAEKRLVKELKKLL